MWDPAPRLGPLVGIGLPGGLWLGLMRLLQNLPRHVRTGHQARPANEWHEIN
jgi:hypothetical protein